MRKLLEEEEARKIKGEICNLCGQSAKNFEPLVYYCNGPLCNGKRIGRGRYFYHATGSTNYHWCSVSVLTSVPCHGDDALGQDFESYLNGILIGFFFQPFNAELGFSP